MSKNGFLEDMRAGGLVRTALLKSVVLKPGKNKYDPPERTALSATDAEFMRWYVKQIDGLGASNRLRFRLLLLGLLLEADGFKERHWQKGAA